MIKNKDGTPCVKSYNPIMAVQNVWAEKDYKLFNKVGKKGIVIDKLRQVVRKEAEVITAKLEAVKMPEIKTKVETAVGEDIEGTIEVWCLPSHNKKYFDGLTKEEVIKPYYGKKFKFRSIVIEEHDLYTILYTNMRSVTVGSIIYPVGSSRWWRVTKVKQEDAGEFLLYGEITDYQPDFSD